MHNLTELDQRIQTLEVEMERVLRILDARKEKERQDCTDGMPLDVYDYKRGIPDQVGIY